MSDWETGYPPSDVSAAVERLHLRLLTAHGFTETITLKTPDLELHIRGSASTEWYRNHLLVWTEHYGQFLVHRDEVYEFTTSRDPEESRG